MSLMSNDDTEKQIEQMCAFILQEAREKADEINLKTQEERDKQMALLDVQGKQRINQDHQRNVKALNTKTKIMKAKANMKQGSRKMEERQRLIEDIKNECLAEMSKFSKTPAYKDFCLKLLVQGLLKMQEKSLKVQCRKSDAGMIEALFPAAIKKYSQVMKESCNMDSTCKIKVDKKHPLPEKLAGGLVVVGGKGKINIDNTLDTRLNIALGDLQPVVRTNLFPSSVANNRAWKDTSMNAGYRTLIMALDESKKLGKSKIVDEIVKMSLYDTRRFESGVGEKLAARGTYAMGKLMTAIKSSKNPTSILTLFPEKLEAKVVDTLQAIGDVIEVLDKPGELKKLWSMLSKKGLTRNFPRSWQNLDGMVTNLLDKKTLTRKKYNDEVAKLLPAGGESKEDIDEERVARCVEALAEECQELEDEINEVLEEFPACKMFYDAEKN